MYEFDKIINRDGTTALKYEALEEKFGRKDLLSFWVADMDFKAPDFLINEIKNRAEHGIFGYTGLDENYYESIIKWIKNKHQWKVEEEWIEYMPGVVPALSVIIKGFTEPEDKIIIQRPVYYPFSKVIRGNDREIVNNPLINIDDEYFMDFKDLEEKVKDSRVKLLIMSNPHNPVGRVWNEEELEKLGRICEENEVLVISDEIHADLIYGNNKHVPFAKISDKLKMNSITCMAPSKTFNIAGLHSSYCIIPNKIIRDKFIKEKEVLSLNMPNVFSKVATEAVYKKGEIWLEELLSYLEENMDLVKEFLEKNIHGISTKKLEGTYLMWINCKKLNLDDDKLDDLFINKANIALDSGHWFGEEGSGYMRLNIACPRENLEKAMKNLKRAVKSLE